MQDMSRICRTPENIAGQNPKMQDMSRKCGTSGNPMYWTQNMVLVYLHTREKIRENGMLPDYCIYKTFFISFSHITQILLKLGNWNLSHIVGFFILYKIK